MMERLAIIFLFFSESRNLKEWMRASSTVGGFFSKKKKVGVALADELENKWTEGIDETLSKADFPHYNSFTKYTRIT